jgi:ADP-ribose pyrophosphatase YjhB (NUDIX family)
MPANIHDFKNAASTVSLIYVLANKVLLIQRDHEPFAGMWALPGGFLDCDKESLEQAAIREFIEETSLIAKIEDIELFKVNSSPIRDPRGHVIDHVFIVTRCTGTPKASDDARNLDWFDLVNLPDLELAFDHFDVLKNYIMKMRIL